MTLQLRQLEAFHAVVETGSMTRAAETLSIPFEINILYPSYMFRSIATLEFVEIFKQSLKPFCL